MKIKINKLPKQLVKAQVGRQIQGSLAITPTKMGGGNYTNSLANQKPSFKQTLQPEKRENSNLEAELGEVAYGGISGDNIPDTFKIGGKRHSQGGTPLNLPDGSFIYSDTASMKIKDPEVLKMFDLKPRKAGYTPADIAKKYDINSYKKILYDPNTDELTRKTATLMIKNYVMKLGYLALIQEASKGFPQGMPEAAEPVLETMGYSMEDFIPEPVIEGQKEIMNQEKSENGAPMQMPNGAPIASEESLYGDDANAQQMPVNPTMPMAQYGMTMGGYDMPMYPDGGISVSTNSSSGTITDAGRLKTEYATGKYKPGTAQPGKQYVDIGDGISGIGTESGKDVAFSYSGGADGSWNPTRQQAIDQYCKNMKNPKSTYFYGVAAKDVAEANFGYLKNSKNPKDQAEYEAILKKLETCKAGGKQTSFEYVKKGEQPNECWCTVDGKEVPGKTNPNWDGKDPATKCLPCDETPVVKDCPCQDAQGNDIPGKFAQKDANGDCLPETCDEIPVTKDCPCEDAEGNIIPGKFAQKDANGECLPETCQEDTGIIPRQETPMYSDVAARNILTQASMNPNVPRTNFAIPYRAEMAGTYEDYLAKIQNNQRAEANTANLIAGTAGGAGEDFAKNMALSGQTAAANENAISNTQNRNVQTGLGVNQFNAQTKNLNNAQRAEVWNNMFATTAGDKLQENMGRNQIKQNTQMAIADAEAEMQGRALSNYQNKQFGTTYRRGLPYFKSGKPQIPEKSSDVNERIKELQAIYGKDAKMGDLLQIYKMEQGQKQVKKGGQNNTGGYVLGDNIFPFMFY